MYKMFKMGRAILRPKGQKASGVMQTSLSTRVYFQLRAGNAKRQIAYQSCSPKAGKIMAPGGAEFAGQENDGPNGIL